MPTIIPVVLRNLVNAPATPPYPATGYTLHAEDMNEIRQAISTGEESIYTKGLLIGTEGIEIQTTTPFIMDDGAFLRFIDAGNDDAVVGSLSQSGELSMTQFTVMAGLLFQADAWIRLQGSLDLFLPEQTQTNVVVYRANADVLDLDVFFDTEVHGLHFLYGTYVANKAGEGYAMRNATTTSRLRLRDDQVLVIEDAVDMDARPVAWTNEREIPTGVPGSTPIQEIVGVDGVYAMEVLASPRTYQIGLEVAGVQLEHLDLGTGANQINVDEIWSAGAGSGVVATLVTVAERAAIPVLISDVATLQVDVTERIQYLRMPDGTLVDVNPANGYIQFVNSSSAIWDSPAAHTVRVVTSGGGGGGGGAVDSVTAGAGIGNSGSSNNPILDVKLASGLTFVGDTVGPDWGGSGAATTVSRSDHDHAGVYSPVAHAHAGVYVPVGGAYADLVAASKIGTGAAQVASGADARFHTQNTDVSTTGLIFMLRSSFVGVPAGGDIVGLTVNRGASTDARLYYQETSSKWVAGLVGSEVALILEGDSRLGDARAPLAHTLSGHTGTITGAPIEPVYVPTDYTPTGVTLEGHLQGIDVAIGAFAPATGLGQMFSCAARSNDVAAGQWLMGSGAAGMKVVGAGTLGRWTMNTQTIIAGSITLKINNLTALTSALATLAAGEFVGGDLGLVVNDGDIVSIQCSAEAGVHNGSGLFFSVVKE